MRGSKEEMKKRGKGKTKRIKEIQEERNFKPQGGCAFGGV